MEIELDTLRQNSSTILQLPQQAQQTLENYLQLKVGGVKIACPYHINPGLRSLNRTLLGKGRPQEIEAFARHYFKRQGMDVQADPARARAFLQACGLGVDCSGFAAWILHELLKSELGSPLWKNLIFPTGRAKLVSKLRPFENISARLLTQERNAESLNSLTAMRPGDLIRAANGRHVLIVIEVGLNDANEAHYFRYAQSSCMYGEASGVRTGHAIIKKPRGSLLEQRWFDNYRQNIVKELIAEGGADSKVVRLKALRGKAAKS